MVKNLIALLAAKFSGWLIKEYNLGSGSTWPGHIALKVNPNFIKEFLKNKKLTIILIAGTNGKTTTSKMLRHILESEGHRVFQNEEGANLLNGMATSLIRNSTVFGNINNDVAIFEVDENNLQWITNQIHPNAVILLNLFRDQLDRYGEVNTIASNWRKALQKLPQSTRFIINADDPQINYIGQSLKSVLSFGMPENEMKSAELGHDVDSVYCPQCGTKLNYSAISYSHLGNYECPTCMFKRDTIVHAHEVSSPLAGIYNMYNTLAAVVTANQLFEIPISSIQSSLTSFQPAFGRQEVIQYKNREIVMLLSKNPTGFNQSIDAVLELSKDFKPTILLLLNDRVPDGHDVSWIWDTDLEKLIDHSNQIFVSGDRPCDMALRIKYSQKARSPKSEDSSETEKFRIIEDVKDAINESIKLSPKDQKLFILPTYSAMLEARKILTGRSIL